MLRGMVFVDHMNFNIAVNNLFRSKKYTNPRLDYNTVFRAVVQEFPNIDYVKSFIFAPEPDEFLKQDAYLLSYYKWVQGLKSVKYIDVIEGRYIARPVDSNTPMDISDKKTYYKVEKGTDINLALHALSKAQSNSYDVAFVLSADTDYISLYKQLKNLGKIVIVCAIKGQQLGKVLPEIDDFKFFDESFFMNHLREPVISLD